MLTKTITDTTVTPNVARTWTYTYDSYGRMLTAKGPRTDVNSTTTYAYYTCTTGSQCGQLHTVTDPGWQRHDLQHLQRPRAAAHDHGPERRSDDADLRQYELRLTSRQVGTETTSFSYYPTGLLEDR